MFLKISCEKHSCRTCLRCNKHKNMVRKIDALKHRFRTDIRMELILQVNVIYVFEQDVFVYDGGGFIGSDGKHSVSKGRVGELDSLFTFSEGGSDGVFGSEDFHW